MPNLVSSPFELIIAGIDRSEVMRSINLSQPSTQTDRFAPITGKVDLEIPFNNEKDFTYSTSSIIAARWAAGALVTYRIANDSGTFVYHPLSGQKLYILKEPSPPTNHILSLEIGCELAYQNQREADRDASGVTVGTDTARNTIVERILKAGKVSAYSIPSLGYPFNCPVGKVGGSFVLQAAKLVGADNHILYCNSAGTVVASPIDLNGTAIATLTIGRDEVDFDPVDGSSIPSVSELTISGVCQVPDRGDYPLLSFGEKEITVRFLGVSGSAKVVVSRSTEEVASENYCSSYEEIRAYDVSFNSGFTGFTVRTGEFFVSKLKDIVTVFDSRDRLSKRITRQYGRLFTLDSPSLKYTPTSPFVETDRTVEAYTYTSDWISESSNTAYKSTLSAGADSINLLPQERKITRWENKNPFWRQTDATETAFTFIDSAYKSSATRTITVNGQTFTAISFPDDIPEPNFVSDESDSKTKNDGSTRPPSITESERNKVKNKEITSVITAIPLAGVPSKGKREPVVVDYLVSNAHAYEYGKLHAVLMQGRKQARLLITQLTDELLELRPRCRIDVVFDGILYRCLVDSITFSQDLKERTIGFICDLISTSPVEDPDTVHKLSTPINALRGDIAIDAIAEGALNQIFNVGTITIDAIAQGVLAEQSQVTGDIAIDAVVFGFLTH